MIGYIMLGFLTLTMRGSFY